MFNSKFNVNRIEWLDLVFENRNQSYGAYVLRKESGNYLRNALLIAVLFFVGMVIGSVLWSRIHQISNQEVIPILQPDHPLRLVKVATISKPPLAQAPKSIKAISPPLKMQEFNQVNYKIPHVVDETKPTVDLPDINTLKTSLIESETVTHGESALANANGSAAVETGNIAGGADGTEIFSAADFLEKYPEFPGGMQAWQKFLSKNLR